MYVECAVAFKHNEKENAQQVGAQNPFATQISCFISIVLAGVALFLLSMRMCEPVVVIYFAA
jgi:hypothetical protein